MAVKQGKITLWELEVFVATAEEASLSAAARRLSTSAATVSQQLTNLERDLGATLLNRSERPVSLTRAGETFLRHANTILDTADEARAALGGLGAPSRFRLGMIEDFDAAVTPRFLTETAREMEGARFLLETGASHRLYEHLDERSLDVIVAAEMGAPQPAHEVHPLLEEPFVIAAPRGALPDKPGLKALKDLPHIQYTTRHHMGRAIADHLAHQSMSFPQRFEMDSYNALLAMVAAGAGWTILTPLGWNQAKGVQDTVDILPLPGRPLSRTISLTARKGQLGDMPGAMARRLKGLIDELVIRRAVSHAPWLERKIRLR